jgi:MOSC domain-containing protein YiiM
MASGGVVVAVSRSAVHGLAKDNQDVVRLAAGVGVEGDVHSGAAVQHMSRREPNPPPNLRQVHLMQTELFDELAGRGFMVAPGNLGENVSTRGIMGVVLVSGLVRPADAIDVELPDGPHTPLAPV